MRMGNVLAVVRGCFLAVVLLAATLCPAQQPLDPDSKAPQVVVIVHKHPVGADIVDVTVSDANYPKPLLQSQMEALGRELQSEPRGLSVYTSGTDPKFKFLKASFAVDGLIDRTNGTIALQAVVRAFLGAPAPYTIDSLLVTFEGESPVAQQTLMEYSSKTVALKMHVSNFPKGIEYRIVALTQDPTQLEIPGRYEPAKNPGQSHTPAKKNNPNWVTWGLVGCAGIAGAALVYFVVSGRAAKKRNGLAPRT